MSAISIVGTTPGLNRRGLLRRAAAAWLSVGLAAPAARAADLAQLRFDELYAGMSVQGLRFSERVLALKGQRVRMRGFAAPPLRADARFLVLTRQPMAICPFCSTDADWPADILVVYCREPSLVPGGQVLLVSGRLEVGSQIDSETGFVSQLRLREAELVRP